MSMIRRRIPSRHVIIAFTLILSLMLAGCARTEQAMAEAKAEMSVTLRGLAVVGIVIVGCASLLGIFESGDYEYRKQRTTMRILGIVGVLVSLPLLLYLLITRGWWQDTVLLIIDVIKEAIFG
ncbi:MAG: hypothetical protein IPO15_01540 [Anaerolineae bacterium]|uniref:hypothetical protein n=1 Tax=Candidatus Amarolinea dominans TaxID=3140696 RepID=UPI003135ED5F|nr:hypothetical protein [Anaerolineae bacterium]